MIPWQILLEDNLQMFQEGIFFAGIIDVIHLGELRIMYEYREMQILFLVKVYALLYVMELKGKM